MPRLFLGSICLAALGFCSCQQQDRTEIDILRFPDEVRTVVSVPGYEEWYHEKQAVPRAASAAEETRAEQESAAADELDWEWEDHGAVSEGSDDREATPAYPPSSIQMSFGDPPR